MEYSILQLESIAGNNEESCMFYRGLYDRRVNKRGFNAVENSEVRKRLYNRLTDDVMKRCELDADVINYSVYRHFDGRKKVLSDDVKRSSAYIATQCYAKMLEYVAYMDCNYGYFDEHCITGERCDAVRRGITSELNKTIHQYLPIKEYGDYTMKSHPIATVLNDVCWGSTIYLVRPSTCLIAIKADRTGYPMRMSKGNIREEICSETFKIAYCICENIKAKADNRPPVDFNPRLIALCKDAFAYIAL